MSPKFPTFNLRRSLPGHPEPGRRLFLKGTAAAGLATVFGIGCRDSTTPGQKAQAEPLPQERHLALLALVGGAVLPSEHSTQELHHIAESFSGWLETHDPAVEPMQRAAYEYDPDASLEPYPRALIDRDLRDIEALAAEQFSRDFEELTVVERQDLLRAIIAERPVTTVRGWVYRDEGHVALSLLDFYYHFAPIHGTRPGT